MTAQEFLTRALRDVVGPNARSHGYRGFSPTWRRSNPSGDQAVVNVQSSLFNTSGRLRCVLNLAVAPEPWLRWQREQFGKNMPKSVPESLGLYRERLHPSSTPVEADGWWEMSNSSSAAMTATDMVAQLESAGWPVLDRMLTTGGMLDRIRSGDLGGMKRPGNGVFFARAESLLLMDQGPSDALEESLQYALAQCPEAQKEHALKFDKWVREQSQAAT